MEQAIARKFRASVLEGRKLLQRSFRTADGGGGGGADMTFPTFVKALRASGLYVTAKVRRRVSTVVALVHACCCCRSRAGSSTSSATRTGASSSRS